MKARGRVNMIRLFASTSILSGGMYLYNITMNPDSQTLVLIYDCMPPTLPANRVIIGLSGGVSSRPLEALGLAVSRKLVVLFVKF